MRKYDKNFERLQGAILGVVILVIVLLLDVEKYADQYNS